MKKVFISCPMKGRTDENIKASMEFMKKLAELYLGEEVEVIDSFLTEEAPGDIQNRPVWYLGKSLQLLSEADYLICPAYIPYGNNGCYIEKEVAYRYDIPHLEVDVAKAACFADMFEDANSKTARPSNKAQEVALVWNDKV